MNTNLNISLDKETDNNSISNNENFNNNRSSHSRKYINLGDTNDKTPFLQINNSIRERKTENEKFEMHSNSDISEQSKSVLSINYLENLINETGFNNYSIINFIATGLFFFSEGAQVFTISILNPIFETIFDKKIYGQFIISFLSSAFYIGYLIGSFLSSYISKKYSRKSPIILSLLGSIMFCFLYILWENIYWLILIKIIIGVFYGSGIPIIYNNFSESIPSKNREVYILSLHGYYRLGILYIILMFNILIPNFEVDGWRFFYLLIIIPNIAGIILYSIFIVDSPKLYYHRNDYENMCKSLLWMNSFNNSGLIFTDNHFYELKRLYNDDKNLILYETLNKEVKKELDSLNQRTILENESMLRREIQMNQIDERFSSMHLFDKNYFKLSIISILTFSFVSVQNIANMYFLPIAVFRSEKEIQTNLGIANSTNSYNLNPNYSSILFISQVVTLLGIFVGIMSTKYTSRKFSIIFGLIFCLISAIICSIFKGAIVVCCSVINGFIVISFVISKLFMIEAFPTQLRDSILGMAFTFKRIFDVFVPITVDSLMNLTLLAPMYMISGICGISIFISSFIPKKYDGKIIV